MLTCARPAQWIISARHRGHCVQAVQFAADDDADLRHTLWPVPHVPRGPDPDSRAEGHEGPLQEQLAGLCVVGGQSAALHRRLLRGARCLPPPRDPRLSVPALPHRRSIPVAVARELRRERADGLHCQRFAHQEGPLPAERPHREQRPRGCGPLSADDPGHRPGAAVVWARPILVVASGHPPPGLRSVPHPLRRGAGRLLGQRVLPRPRAPRRPLHPGPVLPHPGRLLGVGRPGPVPLLDQAESGGPAYPGLAEAVARRPSRPLLVGAAYLSGLVCLAVGTLVYRALSPRFAELV